MSGGWAGTRDASWWNKPETRTPKAVHVAVRVGVSACSGVPLVELYSDLDEVPVASRCRRRACSERYEGRAAG